MKPIQAQKLTEQTQADYDKIASRYAATRQEFWPGLERFKKYFREGMQVLDFGCGPGQMWNLVKEEASEYVGLDFSSELIRIAQKNIQDSRAKFIAGNILNPPTDLGKFDLILCIAVIHQVPSKEFKIWALKNLKSLLAQNGYGIITVWDIKHDAKKRWVYYKYFLKKLLFLERELDWGDVLIPWKSGQGDILAQRYYHVFSQGDFLKLIREAGLEVAEEGFLLDEQGRKRNLYAVVR